MANGVRGSGSCSLISTLFSPFVFPRSLYLRRAPPEKRRQDGGGLSARTRQWRRRQRLLLQAQRLRGLLPTKHRAPARAPSFSLNGDFPEAGDAAKYPPFTTN
uniref:Uncharacterized protein n=1 Tax=Sphaerodactylus townsendi TaxID=933632 RepID=A0ACB8ELT3_9SAUR